MGAKSSCVKKVNPEPAPPVVTPPNANVQTPVRVIPPWYVVYYHAQQDNQRVFTVLWSDQTTIDYPLDVDVIRFKLLARHPMIIYQAGAGLWAHTIKGDTAPMRVAIDSAGASAIVDFAIVDDKFVFVLRRSSLSVYALDIDNGAVNVRLVCIETSFGSFQYDKVAVDPVNPAVFYVHGGGSEFAMACTFTNNEIDGRLLDFNSRIMTIVPGTDDVAHLALPSERLAVSTIRNGKVIRTFYMLEPLDERYEYIQCVVTPTEFMVVGLAQLRYRQEVTMVYMTRPFDTEKWQKVATGVPNERFRALVPGPTSVVNGLLIGYRLGERYAKTPMQIVQFDLKTQMLTTDPRVLFVDEPYAEHINNIETAIQFCVMN